MNDKTKPSEKPGNDQAKNNERPLRESVIPGRSGGTADFSLPTINERDPLPTKPPTKGS